MFYQKIDDMDDNGIYSRGSGDFQQVKWYNIKIHMGIDECFLGPF